MSPDIRMDNTPSPEELNRRLPLPAISLPLEADSQPTTGDTSHAEALPKIVLRKKQKRNPFVATASVGLALSLQLTSAEAFTVAAASTPCSPDAQTHIKIDDPMCLTTAAGEEVELFFNNIRQFDPRDPQKGKIADWRDERAHPDATTETPEPSGPEVPQRGGGETYFPVTGFPLQADTIPLLTAAEEDGSTENINALNEGLAHDEAFQKMLRDQSIIVSAKIYEELTKAGTPEDQITAAFAEMIKQFQVQVEFTERPGLGTFVSGFVVRDENLDGKPDTFIVADILNPDPVTGIQVYNVAYPNDPIRVGLLDDGEGIAQTVLTRIADDGTVRVLGDARVGGWIDTAREDVTYQPLVSIVTLTIAEGEVRIDQLDYVLAKLDLDENLEPAIEERSDAIPEVTFTDTHIIINGEEHLLGEPLVMDGFAQAPASEFNHPNIFIPSLEGYAPAVPGTAGPIAVGYYVGTGTTTVTLDNSQDQPYAAEANFIDVAIPTDQGVKIVRAVSLIGDSVTSTSDGKNFTGGDWNKIVVSKNLTTGEMIMVSFPNAVTEFDRGWLTEQYLFLGYTQEEADKMVDGWITLSPQSENIVDGQPFSLAGPIFTLGAD